jgi:hypothetical protein
MVEGPELEGYVFSPLNGIGYSSFRGFRGYFLRIGRHSLDHRKHGAPDRFRQRGPDFDHSYQLGVVGNLLCKPAYKRLGQFA